MEEGENHFGAVPKPLFREFQPVCKVVALEAHHHHLPVELVIYQLFEGRNLLASYILPLPALPHYRSQRAELLYSDVLKAFQLERVLALEALLNELPDVLVFLSW